MQRVSYQDFQKGSDDFDFAVAGAEHVAQFCSGRAWQCAAHDHLVGMDFGIGSPTDSLILESNGNWVVFAERHEDVFFPLESAWMFGCPLIGDPVAVVEMLEQAPRLIRDGRRTGFVISGVREGSELHRELGQLEIIA
ncbi:MAG: hypothetical protein AAF226_03800 [Verrucomicrobiota bacterium]